ncbi:hypothetical protein [Arcanobacterium bovis]|uniref:PIN domain-containing protein n=1 Tax=Arcanobacterium bovis TaxID=2529275 RepID=A0A4Q9V0H4_9ACTO|nr:hypothetical protein [Arcanobacterium bovis]TBW20846.1 hypothetical protein EZJ44_07925 [Arcanobacterium bovis]
MSSRSSFIIADTSVLLCFICSNNETLLINFDPQRVIYVPQAVADEMERKLTDRQFSCGSLTWNTLISSNRIHILEEPPTLLKIVRGWAGVRFSKEGGLAKNLGEYMAIAHCIEQSQQNPHHNIALIIDDGGGQELARKRQVKTFDSAYVIARAVQLKQINTRSEAKNVWEQLNKFGILDPFDRTILNDPRLYRQT